MPDLAPEKEAPPPTPETGSPGVVTPPRRGPGHRGQDVRDTVAELAARAHEISLEAGSKMSSALKDVINAAAGISAFAVESARDLVQYMVRRGQMTQEEADKLIHEAEDAHRKGRRPAAKASAAAKAVSARKRTATPKTRPAAKKAASSKAAPRKAAPRKPVAKK